VRALGQIERLQDVEIVRVLDVAVRVRRREPDVRDDGILRIVRIDLALRIAGDDFVLADARE